MQAVALKQVENHVAHTSEGIETHIEVLEVMATPGEYSGIGRGIILGLLVCALTGC